MSLIKKILIFFIILLVIGLFSIKRIKYNIIKLNKSTLKEVNTVLFNEKYNQLFNFKPLDFEKYIGNNVIIFNIYNLDSLEFIQNNNILERIKEKYENVKRIDVVLNKNYTSIDNFVLDILGESNIVDFINKHNIKEPLVYLDQKFYNNNAENIYKSGILIFDFNLNKVNFIPKNKLIYEEVDAIIAKTIKGKKYIQNKQKIFDSRAIENSNESYIKSLNKVIYVKKLNDEINFPVLFLNDFVGEKILVSSITGEILYSIGNHNNENQSNRFEDINFCLVKNIKYIDDRLYIVDSCDASIKYLDFESKEVRVLLKNKKLTNFNDFHFINEDNLVITFGNKKEMLNYNFTSQKFDNFREIYNIKEELDNIDNIKEYEGYLYFYDYKSKKLAKFDTGSTTLENVMDLNKISNLNLHNSNIKDLYLLENEIIFLDKYNNKSININIKNNEFTELFFDSRHLVEDLFFTKKFTYMLTNYSVIEEYKINKAKRNINLYLTKSTRNLKLLDDNFYNGKLGEFIFKNNSINFKINFAEYKNSKHLPTIFYLLEKEGNIIIVKDAQYLNGEERILFEELDNNKKYIIYGKIYYIENNKMYFKKIIGNILFDAEAEVEDNIINI